MSREFACHLERFYSLFGVSSLTGKIVMFLLSKNGLTRLQSATGSMSAAWLVVGVVKRSDDLAYTGEHTQ
jgi:hypothetical protein